MPEFRAPIVGMSFRPPALTVIRSLPTNTPLIVVRQPENPHDTNACQVLLPGFCEEGPHKDLFISLRNMTLEPGCDWTEELLIDPLPLGYVGAKTGHAEKLAQFMDGMLWGYARGHLGFSLDGKPELVLTESSFNNDSITATEPQI